jgi:membrane dipeptidase
MTRHAVVALFLVASAGALAAGALAVTRGVPPEPAAALERARAALREVPLIDGHNDLPWAMRRVAWYDFDRIDLRKPQPSLHTDIPRLRAGSVGAQFWSVYVPASMAGQAAVTATLEQVAMVQEMLRRYPDVFERARTADDIERVFRAGRIASLMGIEGGHSIDNSLPALRAFHDLGVGYMTLTHSANVPWADSATDRPRLGGLSRFGEEVVREMNWLGMLVDLSHVSPDTMRHALRVTEAPVIFSHSSARALCDVPRNVPDDVLRLVSKNGGVVMITFVPSFVSPAAAEHGRRADAERERLRKQGLDAERVRAALQKWRQANPEPKATLAQVADHIDHVRKVAGIDHVGIGSDYDGIDTVPAGLEDVSTFPALIAELIRRGYSDDEVKKVAGLNVLRVMREAERVSARLQKQRGPSTAQLADLDRKQGR